MGYSFTPNMWSQPMMNNFNTGLGFGNTFDWNMQNWGAPAWGTSAWTTTGVSSSSQAKETAEEYEARIKKEIAQKSEQRNVLFNQKQELQKSLALIEEQKTALNGTVKEDGSVELKGTIQEDGTIKEEKLENMSTGAKIMRGVGNFFKGIGNVCKSFVGIDPKTGKWDPLKCLRNVGIAVGVAALCVFAAPLGAAAATALGGGAIATGVGTAVAAVPTALAYGGLATGAYMAGKGAYDTAKAKNIEEFDNATQDIGAGVFIGASSAVGLKGMSRSAGVATVSDGSFAGSVSAGTKNILVNPWKASSQNFEWASAGYELGGLNGARQAVKLGQANVAKNSFELKKQQLTTELEQKIADVEARYSGAATPKEKALIELEYDGLVKQYSQLETNLPTNKTQWKTFDSANKEYNSQLKGYKKAMRPWGKGEVEINGQKFTSADKSKLASTIKSISKEQKGITKQMSALKSERFASMRTMASSDAYKTQVEDFGFSTKFYGAPSNWVQSKYYGFTMPKGAFNKTMALGNVAFYASEPAFMLQGAAKTSGAMPLNGLYAYNPQREPGEGLTTIIPAEQYAQAKAGYESQEKQIKDAIGQIDTQIQALA